MTTIVGRTIVVNALDFSSEIKSCTIKEIWLKFAKRATKEESFARGRSQ